MLEVQKLKLKGLLLEKVRAGNKRCTTRLGLKSKYQVGYVELVNADNPSDTEKEYIIEKIEVLEFGTLTEEIAKKDGFHDLTALRRAVIDIYEQVPPEDHVVTVIHFEKIKYQADQCDHPGVLICGKCDICGEQTQQRG